VGGCLQRTQASSNTFSQHHPILHIRIRSLGTSRQLDHGIGFVGQPKSKGVDGDLGSFRTGDHEINAFRVGDRRVADQKNGRCFCTSWVRFTGCLGSIVVDVANIVLLRLGERYSSTRVSCPFAKTRMAWLLCWDMRLLTSWPTIPQSV